MISKLNMKRKIGRKLGDYRRSQKLRLDHVAKQSGVPWQMIDSLELGNDTQWGAYKLLLDFYDKGVGIELTERDLDGDKPKAIDEQIIKRYLRQEPVVHSRVDEVPPMELS